MVVVGGTGDVVQIKKMWSMTGTEQNPTFTEIEGGASYGVRYYVIDEDEVSTAIATDDDNTPNVQTMENVALFITPATQSVIYKKNIGMHTQQYKFNDSRTIVTLFNESPESPSMQITILTGGR